MFVDTFEVLQIHACRNIQNAAVAVNCVTLLLLLQSIFCDSLEFYHFLPLFHCCSCSCSLALISIFQLHHCCFLSFGVLQLRLLFNFLDFHQFFCYFFVAVAVWHSNPHFLSTASLLLLQLQFHILWFPFVFLYFEVLQLQFIFNSLDFYQLFVTIHCCSCSCSLKFISILSVNFVIVAVAVAVPYFVIPLVFINFWGFGHPTCPLSPCQIQWKPKGQGLSPWNFLSAPTILLSVPGRASRVCWNCNCNSDKHDLHTRQS